MAGKRQRADEIVTKLRQVDVLNAQGKSMAEAILSTGVTSLPIFDRSSED
jgi:putative transposase